jgi:hypothetical protein
LFVFGSTAFNYGIQLKRIQLQPIIVDSQGRVLNSWADIINRANLGMEVMHERNAHNFPLDLASVGSIYQRLINHIPVNLN